MVSGLLINDAVAFNAQPFNFYVYFCFFRNINILGRQIWSLLVIIIITDKITDLILGKK